MCFDATLVGAAEGQSDPIAADARLAGDSRQTRFVLDLDKTIQFRAFALALRWPIRIGWSWTCLRSVFSLLPEPAPRGAG